jgi:hypothetical protein
VSGGADEDRQLVRTILLRTWRRRGRRHSAESLKLPFESDLL